LIALIMPKGSCRIPLNRRRFGGNRLKPYSQSIVLAKPPDGRSKEGKLLRATRKALFDHLGGEDRITAPQRALIERCAMLQLRISMLDDRLVNGGFTEFDAKEYLAWSNSLTRTMVALGLEPGGAGRRPTANPLQQLRDHLKRHREAVA
jgi:hypothetical protein